MTNYFDPHSIVKVDENGLTSLSFNIPLELLSKAYHTKISINPRNLFMYIVSYSVFKNKQQKFMNMQKEYGLYKEKEINGEKKIKLNKSKISPKSHDGLLIDFYEFMAIYKEYFQKPNSKDFLKNIGSFMNSSFIHSKHPDINEIIEENQSYSKLKKATKAKNIWFKVKTHDMLGIQKEFEKAWYHITLPVFKKTDSKNLDINGFTKLLIMILASKPEAVKTEKKHKRESTEGLTHVSIAEILGVTQPHVTQTLSDFEKIYSFKEVDEETYSRTIIELNDGLSGYAFQTPEIAFEETINEETGEVICSSKRKFFRLVGTKVIESFGFKFYATTRLRDKKTGRIVTRQTLIGKPKRGIGVLKFLEHLNKEHFKKNSFGLQNLNNLLIDSKRSGASLVNNGDEFDSLQAESTVPGIESNKDVHFGIRGTHFLRAAQILKFLTTFNETKKAIESWSNRTAKTFVGKATTLSFSKFKRSISYMAYDLKQNYDTYLNDFDKQKTITLLYTLLKVLKEFEHSTLFVFDSSDLLINILNIDTIEDEEELGLPTIKFNNRKTIKLSKESKSRMINDSLEFGIHMMTELDDPTYLNNHLTAQYSFLFNKNKNDKNIMD